MSAEEGRPSAGVPPTETALRNKGDAMSTRDFFAATYAAAREKFVGAARVAGARLTEYEHTGLGGPEGEPLIVDVATLGRHDPNAILLLISGTHGAEGFCGSGCQVGFLVDELYGALPLLA